MNCASSRQDLCLAVLFALGVAIQVTSAESQITDQGGAASFHLITGVVTTIDAAARPVGRAIVTLTDGHSELPRTVITDDDGRFRFPYVAAGRYSIIAIRAGYISVPFGAVRADGPAATLNVSGNSPINPVRLFLQLGGSVTGIIRDQNGSPFPDIQVALARRDWQQDWTVGDQLVRTDERGRYRVSGLIPGDYLVVARLTQSATTDLVSLSRNEVDRILAELASATAKSTTDVRSESRSVHFAPVFYPGVTRISDASIVTARPGEENSGIDFVLAPVPKHSIEGVAVTPGAPVPIRVSLTATHTLGAETRTVSTTVDGRFTFSNVPAGTYLVQARSSVRDDPRSAQKRESAAQMWGSAEEVLVAESDVVGLRLVLKPVLALTGQLELLAENPLVIPRSARILLMTRHASRSSTGFTVAAEVTVPVATKTTPFKFAGLLPGEYRVAALLSDSSAGLKWWTQAVTLAGSLLPGGALRLSELDVTELVIHATDRQTTIAASLEPVERSVQHFVVLFPVEEALRSPALGRIRTAQPSGDGTFEFQQVLAGDYWVCALGPSAPTDWWRSSFLSQAIPSCAKVSVLAGERKSLTLKLRN